MSRFARPSDWLRQLFIPSRTGWQPPNQVSEEVSLTQPYDGGGFAIWPIGQWSTSVVTAAAASGFFDLFAINSERIVRILSVSVTYIAGVNPQVYLVIQPPSGDEVGLSELITPPAGGQPTSVPLTSPIVPPGHALRARWFGGDAATQIMFRSLRCEAPLGSVFYV